MSKKRSHGDGGIDQRGENSFGLRYRINGKRYSVAFHGTLSDARKKLRELIRSGDVGDHVAPDKITIAQWIEHWLGQKRVGRRALERYTGLLRTYIIPALGNRRLQELQPIEIDRLYAGLAAKPATARYVHVVFGGCLNAAVRKGLLVISPMGRVEGIPANVEADHGTALDAEDLGKLLDGFRGTSLFPIVATAALTGARRGEILALRWNDFDPVQKTLRIERALEKASGGVTIKPPKTKRGTRTITIDDELVGILLAEREKHLRLKAGVSESAAVDLSLVKLPDATLMFPSIAGAVIDLTKPRDPHSVTVGFLWRASKLGFKDVRFHDLRGAHETMLLDNGVPVHVVAARCGHDPAVLLRSYAKRTRKADTSAAAVIGNLSRNILGR
jgi:integrase